MKILLVALLLVSCSTPTLEPPLAQAKRVHMVFDVNNGQGTCWPVSCEREPSGIYLVRYVTAGHTGWAVPLAINAEGHEFVFVERHPTLDLAVITFRSQSYVHPHKLRLSPMIDGERVYHSGFPMNEWTLTEGFVTGPKRVTASVAPGSSGGPIFDRFGRVIAIVVAMRDSAHGVIWHRVVVIPVVEFADWL